MIYHNMKLKKLNFDSVIMLTFSDWKKEARSNRYHFASRFANFCPVYFVQFDLKIRNFYLEKSSLNNVFIVHCNQKYLNSINQKQLLNIFKKKIKCNNPILWIYNYLLDYFIKNFSSKMKVFHATEDFFSSDLFFKPKNLNKLKSILNDLNFLVSCSEGVNRSYLDNGNYNGKSLVLQNGVDYKFYAPKLNQIDKIIESRKENLIFYQGGINDRLDLELLNLVMLKLSNFEFNFFGRVNFTDKNKRKLWKSFFHFKNFKYHNFKSVEQLRSFGYNSTLGIMPFVKKKYIVESSLPLKSFEYLACGLPVVSTTINSLKKYKDFFLFADNFNEFENKILLAKTKSKDLKLFKSRLEISKSLDYDLSFENLLLNIN